MPETPIRTEVRRFERVAAAVPLSRVFRLTFAPGEGPLVDGALPTGTGGGRVTVVAWAVGAALDQSFGDALEYEVRLDGDPVGSADVPLSLSLGVGEPPPDAVTFTVDCPAGTTPCAHDVEIVANARTSTSATASLAYVLRAERTLTNRRGEHEGTFLEWTLLAP